MKMAMINKLQNNTINAEYKKGLSNHQTQLQSIRFLSGGVCLKANQAVLS
jgi:hypothetical protein